MAHRCENISKQNPYICVLRTCICVCRSLETDDPCTELPTVLCSQCCRCVYMCVCVCVCDAEGVCVYMSVCCMYSEHGRNWRCCVCVLQDPYLHAHVS
jgi:hypothetical protein